MDVDLSLTVAAVVFGKRMKIQMTMSMSSHECFGEMGVFERQLC